MSLAENFEAALKNGREYLESCVADGNTVILRKERAPVQDSGIDYRYSADNDFARVFLMKADPGVSGLAQTLLVNEILNQVRENGCRVVPSIQEHRIRITPSR